MNLKASAGRLALLAAALIWGSSFVIMKNTVDDVPVFLLLAILGIVNDPTTAGTSDSAQAMTYQKPKK